MENNTVEIVCFSEETKDELRKLNYEWLEKYFYVEEQDALVLSDPQRYIIDKGGFIFYASYKNEIVGSVVLMKIAEGEYELGKMAVTQAVQGKGVVRILLEYTLDFARKQKFQKLILFTDSVLKAAIHLYTQFGFQKVKFESGSYARGDVKMQLDLVD